TIPAESIVAKRRISSRKNRGGAVGSPSQQGRSALLPGLRGEGNGSVGAHEGDVVRVTTDSLHAPQEESLPIEKASQFETDPPPPAPLPDLTQGTLGTVGLMEPDFAGACPACGTTGYKKLFEGTDRLYRTTSKIFQIVEC